MVSCNFMQILECVAINLTLVYAVLSYSSVKKLMSASEQNVRSCILIMLCYLLLTLCIIMQTQQYS